MGGNMEPENQPKEVADKQEYTEVCENFRHYSNLRFAILTLFFAVYAGLLSILFGDKPLQGTMRGIVEGAGLIVTWVFWAYSSTTMNHLEHYGKRASLLEKQLGFLNLSARPVAPWWRNMRNASRLLYATTLIFWMIVLIFSL
jgi:hypothetical protein